MARTRQDDERGDPMKALTTLMMILSMTQALAVTQDPELFTKECPEKFSGKVIDLSSLGAPLSSPMLEKIRVVFSVLQTERGTSRETYSLDVLKFGPTQFEKGATYDLEMNQGFICSVLKVD